MDGIQITITILVMKMEAGIQIMKIILILGEQMITNIKKKIIHQIGEILMKIIIQKLKIQTIKQPILIIGL